MCFYDTILYENSHALTVTTQTIIFFFPSPGHQCKDHTEEGQIAIGLPEDCAATELQTRWNIVGCSSSHGKSYSTRKNFFLVKYNHLSWSQRKHGQS